MEKFIRELLEKEDRSITETMAFMSYNPSIGRVFEKGGVEKFKRVAVKIVGQLPTVKAQEDFDTLHDEYVNKVVSNIETCRGSRASYGQSQKPINVFLKLYVDWAHRPNASLRKMLLPWLHVPLDSILMETIKLKYTEWYEEDIASFIREKTQAFSLSKIDKRMYYRWQTFFRSKYPKKPLIFDIAWALNR